MNFNWLFIALGMHYIQKIKLKKEKLELTPELWIFFTFQQGLAPSWQHVGCQLLCQLLHKGSKVMLVFLEEKLKAPITHFSLLCKFSDQIQNEKDWTFRFFKNKYVCLIKTGNDRVEKFTPFRWIGPNFKLCYKRNDTSKLLEK